MRASTVKYTVLSWVSLLTMIILLLVPFQGFLPVWLSSIIGHYTALRLWDEVLLAVSVIGVLYLFLFDRKIRYHTLTRRLIWTILLYIAVNIVWGILALNQHDVTLKALGYGLIVDLRFLIFFLVAWSVATRLGRLRNNWQSLVLIPAAIVVAFGLLQALILPRGFLSHFGYGPGTISPYETINNNPNYVRVISTLRGANPLGAYLIVPITVLGVLLIRGKRNWRYILLMIGSLVVLFYSFSRSAWAGAAVSLVVALFLSRLSHKTQRVALVSAGVLVVIAGILAFALRHNTTFQNFAYHTQTHSAVSTTSDQSHFAAWKAGWNDLTHHMWGNGPGTAGPASRYNAGHPARITENYFLQVGQETGWIGLILFILINVGVGLLLYVRREDPLALSLFASLIGLTFINLFLPAWTDDTLAYIWWGLAGVALAPNPKAEAIETHAKPAKKTA